MMKKLFDLLSRHDLAIRNVFRIAEIGLLVAILHFTMEASDAAYQAESEAESARDAADFAAKEAGKASKALFSLLALAIFSRDSASRNQVCNATFP